MIGVNTVIFLLFVATTLAFFAKKRKRVKREGVFLLYRTKRFVSLFDFLAKKSPFLWRLIATLSIFLSLLLSIEISELIITTVLVLRENVGVQLILPSPFPAIESKPFLFLIPCWMWLVALVLIIFPHEAMHGIVARCEKIKLKTTGLALLLIFPGAFVEPDENSFKRARLVSRLRVLAVGSAANYIVGFLLLHYLLPPLWSATYCDYLVVTKVFREDIKFLEGARIYAIDNASAKPEIDTLYALLPASPAVAIGLDDTAIGVFSASGKIDRSKNYTVLYTDRGVFNVTLREDGKIGIQVKAVYKSYALKLLLSLLILTAVLSIAVALVNMLPIYPLDGGQMLFNVLSEILGEEKARRATEFFSALFIFLIVYSALPR